MQIQTLYIPLKDVKGGFIFIQQVKAKHAHYIERFEIINQRTPDSLIIGEDDGKSEDPDSST